MMMDDGWEEEEMLRPAPALASPTTGLMRARQRFRYTKVVKLKWMNVSKVHGSVVEKNDVASM